ncbi:hypothetical protein N3K66_004459 [Trichothecium roseum]|uniref:Uncharacterized protein n=1 Tax=Trichothecium roseum TaxID=47278 RepID=A0ACC0V1P6_9HYPO|nr:hypothetical protein N3K66_004459 [Trichothecium roseum]
MKMQLPNPRGVPTKRLTRYAFITFVLTFVIANYSLWSHSRTWDTAHLRGPVRFGVRHPVKQLMKEARERHQATLSKRSFDLGAAAARYRERRGRHPPPGFDQWFEAAAGQRAVVVEDFFDRIYKDLTPFWALEPETLRERAHSWPWVVRIRNGTAHGDGDVKGLVPWLKHWTGLVGEFAEYLPDVDMPINYMDEPRIAVPFDVVNRLVAEAESTKLMPEAGQVKSEYTRGLDYLDENKPAPYEPQWFGPDSAYWDVFVKTCGEDTPAWGVEAVRDFTQPAEFPPSGWSPEYSEAGYVRNWTAAMDPCLQPHLRQLHGTFVEPISLKSTPELIPLFGGSKLPTNNEILIPGAMYLTKDEFYSGGESNRGPKWAQKKDGLVWRGDGSGGRTKPETWHHFQRHRLVQMLNATTVAEAEASPGRRTDAFELPNPATYPQSAASSLSGWISSLADAGFVHFCFPHRCDWGRSYFSEVRPVPMKRQYAHKLLPDVDGNSFSARFRAFLRSSSAPLKSTIYAEWHDDRLVPWVHFIPMDNTFRDLYGLLGFFASGDEGDAAARYVAETGMAWSDEVLRREDMGLYVWRLLLEWARVCDEDRHHLGYVGDI